MAGMWGGTNPPVTIEGVVQYFYSLEHFLDETKKNNCDITINNHPDMDGYAKIEYVKKRTSHMPNIYIYYRRG